MIISFGFRITNIICRDEDITDELDLIKFGIKEPESDLNTREDHRPEEDDLQ